jgi:hypothetical protein
MRLMIEQPKGWHKQRIPKSAPEVGLSTAAAQKRTVKSPDADLPGRRNSPFFQKFNLERSTGN